MPLLQSAHIPVFIIALGTQGYNVGTDSAGLPIISTLDQSLLEQYANTTNGQLYSLPTGGDVTSVVSDISHRLPHDTETTYSPLLSSLNDELFLPMLILFVILLGLSIERRSRILPKK